MEKTRLVYAGEKIKFSGQQGVLRSGFKVPVEISSDVLDRVQEAQEKYSQAEIVGVECFVRKSSFGNMHKESITECNVFISGKRGTVTMLGYGQDSEGYVTFDCNEIALREFDDLTQAICEKVFALDPRCKNFLMELLSYHLNRLTSNL